MQQMEQQYLTRAREFVRASSGDDGTTRRSTTPAWRQGTTTRSDRCGPLPPTQVLPQPQKLAARACVTCEESEKSEGSPPVDMAASDSHTVFAPPPAPSGGGMPWSDPRPDLAADHEAWERLLFAAFRTDGGDPTGVSGSLLGLRCMGAALTHRRARWRLGHGEMAPTEYGDDRQRYLVPHATTLTRLLSSLEPEGKHV